MRLITEEIKSASVTKEKNFWYITGPFIQSGIVNGNNRIYPYAITKPAVDKYIEEKVKTRRAVGELNHPPTPEIDFKNASHVILSLTEDMIDIDKGICNWNGKARILKTPNGLIVEALLEGGVQIAVSSRALGSIKELNGINEVQEDFRICTPADIVYEPSAPNAFVEGILENKEWIMNKQGLLREKFVHEYKKQLKVKTAKEIQIESYQKFQKFLSLL